MMTKTTPLPLRNDTILGVCEAIGRDFGFNPIWLRLAFIAPLFFAPTATILAYFAYQQVWHEAKRVVRPTGALDPRNQAKARRAKGKAGVIG